MSVRVPESTRRELARRLAEDIDTVGKMHTPAWRAAVEEVPRHISTKPDLMIRMLEALEVTDGMRVLEIGTGYNAALRGTGCWPGQESHNK